MREAGIRLDRLDERVQAAIESFWTARSTQEAKQGKATGDKDRGGRSAVTGGGHIDGLITLIHELLVENGIPEDSIYAKRRTVDLPLYFRPHRDWDLVLVHRQMLVACIEFKSQVGPSFGNNYNNRVQEAVGDGHDLAVAYREGLFKPSPRPWTGYLMLLEDTERSRSAVAVRGTHFPVDPAFQDASYAKRYEVTITRLVRESLYDAATLILTTKGPPCGYKIPNEEIGFRRMVLSLIGHAMGVISE